MSPIVFRTLHVCVRVSGKVRVRIRVNVRVRVRKGQR